MNRSRNRLLLWVYLLLNVALFVAVYLVVRSAR